MHGRMRNMEGSRGRRVILAGAGPRLAGHFLAIVLNASRALRQMLVALVVVGFTTACGDAVGRHAFNEKTDRVRVGMAESEVRTIMGVPSSSPTGDVLVAECGQVG